MRRSKATLFQLRQCDPVAWTVLLNSQPDVEGVEVTAVTEQPLPSLMLLTGGSESKRTRYTLTLADHTDPITFISKQTNAAEVNFYQTFAKQFPYLAPTPLLAETSGLNGWIITDDVPNHFPPHTWRHNDVEDIIGDLAAFHATYWDTTDTLADLGWLSHFISREQKQYTWEALKKQKAIFFDEGPGAILSEHAINHVGRLAPVLLEAANGLVVMRTLDGWPGVLGESHLQAAADLLDDPVPMLEPLLDLPATLLHGHPHPYQWSVTLFDQRRLFNWNKPTLGPGILDLVFFLEQFDLLYHPESQALFVRQERPSSEETIVDSYLLALSAELGSQSQTRDVRRALAAARCLYVLTTSFPHFASWFNDMPNRYVWQRINRMSDEELQNSQFSLLAAYRPYLSGLFQRFLQSYYAL
ncbi:MAG: hypothetical protein H6668_08380 [Ardenticatenaceae bacterium]|nr:hypothetical protein [Ardenticatenaceae bacterium]